MCERTIRDTESGAHVKVNEEVNRKKTGEVDKVFVELDAKDE